MSPALVLAVALAVSPAAARPVGGADPHAAAPTGFPGAYLGSVAISLREDPLYASRFLDAFDTHLRAVAVMTAPPAVAAYLEQSSARGGDLNALRAELGRKPLDAPKAAALLIANALRRPEQFREILDGFERLKPGLSRRTAELLRRAKVTGSLELLKVLRAAGERDPKAQPLTYGPDGLLGPIFDGSASAGPEGVVLDEPAASAPASSTGYGPDGRPRPSGLTRSPRP